MESVTTEIPPLPFMLRQQCERLLFAVVLAGCYVLNQQTVQGENHARLFLWENNRRQGSVVIGNGGLSNPHSRLHYLSLSFLLYIILFFYPLNADFAVMPEILFFYPLLYTCWVTV